MPTTHPKFWEKLVEADEQNWLVSANSKGDTDIFQKFVEDPAAWARGWVGQDVLFVKPKSGGKERMRGKVREFSL